METLATPFESWAAVPRVLANTYSIGVFQFAASQVTAVLESSIHVSRPTDKQEKSHVKAAAGGVLPTACDAHQNVRVWPLQQKAKQAACLLLRELS